MFTSDPREGLLLAHEHAHRLRAEASAERLRGTSGGRRALARVLRRVADRLDPAPRIRRPALPPHPALKERQP